MEIVRRNGGLEEFVYKHISERLAISREEFMDGIKGWNLRPIEHSGNLAAVVATKGNEVHVAVDPEYKGKWLGKDSIRSILGGILGEYGHAVTSVGYDNTDASLFLRRLGFVPDSIVYRLEKLNHIKE